jgi:ankyrin repeat protein
VVKELINAGVDINGTNNDHNNTLWFACFGNHYDLINLLLDTKIDINN